MNNSIFDAKDASCEAFDAPGFLRISYATSLQELKRGTERLLTFVRSLESRKAVAG